MDLFLFQEEYNKADNELIPALQDIGLLTFTPTKECCNNPSNLSVSEENVSMPMTCKACSTTIDFRKGSFFSDFDVSFHKALLLAYCFVAEVSEHTAGKLAGVSRATVTSCYRRCRNVCAKFLDRYPVKLGGVGEVCEVYAFDLFDPIHLAETEQNSHQEANILLIVERRRGLLYCFRLQNVSTEGFVACIKELIQPGTILVTEKSPRYRTLAENGFHHQPIDPALKWTFECDNHKHNLQAFGRPELSIDELDSLLDEYTFRGLFFSKISHKRDYFPHFLAVIADCF